MVHWGREFNRKSTALIVKCLTILLIGTVVVTLNEQLVKKARKGRLFENEQRRRNERSVIPEVETNDTKVFLWPDDPVCSEFHVNFAQKIDRPTYLVSFSHSGNSWTRYLVERATGIFTGSVYNDETLYKRGFKGELEPHDSGRLILVKAQTKAVSKDAPPVQLEGAAPSVILLIRNPADAIASQTGFMNDGQYSSSSKQDEDSDRGAIEERELRKKFRENIEKWSKINESLLVWTKKLLVVFYEDLVTDTTGQLDRILSFINIVKDRERIDCLVKYMEAPPNWGHNQERMDALTHGDKKQLAQAMSSTIGLLRLRGLKTPQSYIDWILPLNPYLNYEL